MARAARHGPRSRGGSAIIAGNQEGSAPSGLTPSRSTRRRSDRGWPPAARSPRHGGTSRRQVESVPIPAGHSRHRSANSPREGLLEDTIEDINVRRGWKGRLWSNRRPSRLVRDPACATPVCAPPKAPIVGAERAAGLAGGGADERADLACPYDGLCFLRNRPPSSSQPPADGPVPSRDDRGRANLESPASPAGRRIRPVNSPPDSAQGGWPHPRRRRNMVIRRRSIQGGKSHRPEERCSGAGGCDQVDVTHRPARLVGVRSSRRRSRLEPQGVHRADRLRRALGRGAGRGRIP